MKCFDENEIKVIKSALKSESRKKKIISESVDIILEKVEHYKCPEKTVSINEIKNLPLAERIKFAKMIR